MRNLIKEQLNQIELKQICSYIKRTFCDVTLISCNQGDYTDYLNFDEKEYGGDEDYETYDTVASITDVFVYHNNLVFDLCSIRLLKNTDNKSLAYLYIGETCSHFDINEFYIRFFDLDGNLEEILHYNSYTKAPSIVVNSYLKKKPRKQ